MRERQAWLREVICREYAQVDVRAPGKSVLSQNLAIYPWHTLQLSVIHSSGIGLERVPKEPYLNSQDAYFAVLLLAGAYCLSQNGREVFLQPGDMTVYDATRPHRIHCPQDFTKLIIAIPRPAFQDRIASIEQCSVLPIAGRQGMGHIAANFLRSVVSQTGQLTAHDFAALADQALDLLTLAVASVRPVNYSLSRSRAAALNRIKAFIEPRLSDPALAPAAVAQGTGLSLRYINALLAGEDTSLMRYIGKRRLDKCRKDMLDPIHAGRPLSEIAFRWGFNDAAHFSRIFKQQFGCSPRNYVALHVGARNEILII